MQKSRSLIDELINERRIEEFRENIQDALRLSAEDPKFRRVAGRAYVSLAGTWRFSHSQAARFLSISEDDYQAWLGEDFDRLGEVELEKISCLLGIYKYLGRLYSGQVDRIDKWLKRDNSGPLYSGRCPYELLVGADADIFHLVRRDVAAHTV